MGIPEFAAVRRELREAPLREYVRSLHEPCLESELMRIAFPEFPSWRAEPIQLYLYHFALFQNLYQWQTELLPQGWYLHVHFMRTCLQKIPGPGECRFFEDGIVKYCHGPAADGEYCRRHAGDQEAQRLGRLSDRYFYLNEANLGLFDAAGLEGFFQGTGLYLAHAGEMEHAFDLLELPKTADQNRIRRRFHELAKDLHPDRDAGSHEAFCRLNRAYHLLIKTVGAFRPADDLPRRSSTWKP